MTEEGSMQSEEGPSSEPVADERAATAAAIASVGSERWQSASCLQEC